MSRYEQLHHNHVCLQHSHFSHQNSQLCPFKTQAAMLQPSSSCACIKRISFTTRKWTVNHSSVLAADWENSRGARCTKGYTTIVRISQGQATSSQQNTGSKCALHVSCCWQHEKENLFNVLAHDWFEEKMSRLTRSLLCLVTGLHPPVIASMWTVAWCIFWFLPSSLWESLCIPAIQRHCVQIMFVLSWLTAVYSW